jgi:putative nucleotidyltransferase with HDIG domain
MSELRGLLSRRPRILYVDDEPFVLNAFRRMVALAGFEPVTFGSPGEALAWLTAQPTHGPEALEVVCSDFRMPEMTGLEFLAAAHRVAPGALRVLITAHHDFDMAVDAFQVGIFRIIPKPWKRELLLGTLSEAVETVRLGRENDRLHRLVTLQAEELIALNSTLDRKLARRTEQVIGSLITCLDYRDEETMAHSKRVSLFTREIALRIGIAEPELTDIEWGAMLHDIGKIGVPDRILLKPARLTPDEWKIMRRHASIGFAMMARIDFLATAAKVVRDHHESWDGSGYPHGRSGADIYIGARIFAVADTFDAMTSDRPYRKAQSDEAAHAEIERVSGSQLDPRCVRAFAEVEPETWARIREDARLWAATHAATGEAESVRKAEYLAVV